MQRELDRATMTEDFVAAAEWLMSHERSTGRVGAVGFCFGGGMVGTLAVRLPNLAAGVPFYGSQPAAEDVARIQAPLMIHYAGLDERVNAGWPAFEEALRANGKEYTMHMYPDVNHGFHNDTTPRYDEAAASYGSGLECKPGDADLSFSLKLAKEAAKGGVWFRQLMPGRDIAISPPSSQVEGLIFGAAKQMRNFIYLVGCATTRGESQESPHTTQGPLIASRAFSFDRAGMSECVCTRLNVCCFRSPLEACARSRAFSPRPQRSIALTQRGIPGASRRSASVTR